MTDVRSFAVGPIQENAYFVRADPSAGKALLVDPGEEPQRLLSAAEDLGVEVEAILITHCHFDHVGAVAPLARATGAPVYCPQGELAILADIPKWTMPGFGPYESWQAEHSLAGGERLRLAGLDVEVLFTPGHSPGHLTYAIGSSEPRSTYARSTYARSTYARSTYPGSDASGSRASHSPPPAAADSQPPSGVVLLSGDVLFQGSVGRTDFPGSDWPTLERSIATLMERFPRETVVYPGHMGATTLGREWEANPFLGELRAAAPSG